MVISISSSEDNEQPSHHKKTSPSEQTIVQSMDPTIPSQGAISKSKTEISKRPLSGAIIKTIETNPRKSSTLKPQTLSTSEAKTES
jgi:hypothetical protein